MQYIEFCIKKYKGIEEVRIPMSNTDDRKPICLLGLNESGKTTTLEAINTIGKLCRGGSLKNGQLQSMRPKGVGFTGSVELSTIIGLNPAEQEQVQAIIKEHQEEINQFTDRQISIRYKYFFENHEYKKMEIQLKEVNITDTEDTWGGKVREYIAQNIPEILYYEDFIFDIPEKIAFKNNSSNTNTKSELLNREWQAILQDIYTASRSEENRDAAVSFSFENDVVNWMTSETNRGDEEAPKTRLQGMENVLDAFITEKWKSISQQTQSFNRIKIESSVRNRKYNDFSIRVYSKNAPYKIHERSKGFRWFFTFLILTEIRKYRGRETIFLLDEPASNLHPSAQESIYNALIRLCDKANVVYATHSPYLLNKENLQNTFLIINDSNEFEDAHIKDMRAVDLIDNLHEESTVSLSAKINYIKPILDFICFELPTIASESYEDIIQDYRGKLQNEEMIEENIPKIKEAIKNRIKDISNRSWIQQIGENTFYNLLTTLIIKSMGL